MPFVTAKPWPHARNPAGPAFRPAGRLHVAAALLDGVCLSALLWLVLALLWR